MAELADALDLGSSEATRTGSIPARCTRMKKSPVKTGLYSFFEFLIFSGQQRRRYRLGYRRYSNLRRLKQ